ncbi:hypothetical protein [Methylobacterium radiotolerans]|uniref:hypothetical protein n=1 Tax=Methylobacterium radiotolerans TaxID=31998 RepID=UPI0038D252F9
MKITVFHVCMLSFILSVRVAAAQEQIFPLLEGEWYDKTTQTNVHIDRFGKVSSGSFGGLQGMVKESGISGSNFAFSSETRNCYYYITVLDDGTRSNWKLMPGSTPSACPPGGDYEIVPDPSELLKRRRTSEAIKGGRDRASNSDASSTLPDETSEDVERRARDEARRAAEATKRKRQKAEEAAAAKRAQREIEEAESALRATAIVENRCKFGMALSIRASRSNRDISFSRYVPPFGQLKMNDPEGLNAIDASKPWYYHYGWIDSQQRLMLESDGDYIFTVQGREMQFQKASSQIHAFQCPW